MPPALRSHLPRLSGVVEFLSHDLELVFNSLFRNRDASIVDSLFEALPQHIATRVVRYGLYFTTEDFSAGRLKHEFHPAAQPAPDHHGGTAI